MKFVFRGIVLSAAITCSCLVFIVLQQFTTDDYHLTAEELETLNKEYNRIISAYTPRVPWDSMPGTAMVNARVFPLQPTRDIWLGTRHNTDFVVGQGVTCFMPGTLQMGERCVCDSEWRGERCDMPKMVPESQLKYTTLKPRKQQRRIIYSIPFNMEFEMLEIRVGEVGDLMDLIILVESNFTGFGNVKPLWLHEHLNTGFLKNFHDKIEYVSIDTFPGAQNEDGEKVDVYTKNYGAVNVIPRIRDLENDDIFIIADSDELHSREVLLFLRNMDGFPDPFGIHLKKTMFGFFWECYDTHVGLGSTIHTLLNVYKSDANLIRHAPRLLQSNWSFGSESDPAHRAGWHCSWCFDAATIQLKLISAYNYDFPRFGSYSDKLSLTFIESLIKQGYYFNEKDKLVEQDFIDDRSYAPLYVLKNRKRFMHLLVNLLV